MRLSTPLVALFVFVTSVAAAPPDQTDTSIPIPIAKTKLADLKPLLGKWEVVSIERGSPLPDGEVSTIEQFLQIEPGMGVELPLT